MLHAGTLLSIIVFYFDRLRRLLLEDRRGGGELFLMTVHLARGNARLREEQAAGLREWARTLRRPAQR